MYSQGVALGWIGSPPWADESRTLAALRDALLPKLLSGAGGTHSGGRMSSLKMAERQILEQHFVMEKGHVLNFSDRTFGEFVLEAVGSEIHDAKYREGGTSKANKLRTFWKLEPDQMVGRLILALVDYAVMLNPTQDANAKARAEKCRQIAARLLSFDPLKASGKS